MRLSIVVAMARNRVIGRDGRLPWYLPEDLKHFKALTSGHTVIMGRRTFESLRRPLPNRTNIVVTRNPEYEAAGAIVVRHFDEAIARAEGEDEVFILGGAEIYRQALHRAERMYLTLVDAEVDGDTFFPEFDPDDWRLVEERVHPPDERHEYQCIFRILERVR